MGDNHRSATEITALLQRVHDGDREALQALIPLVYTELKKLASAHLRNESRNSLLETTALVHEAFVRLAGGRHPSYENRTHFYGIASRLMRQILVDMARARAAEKRNVGEKVDLAVIPDVSEKPAASILEIDDALGRLQEFDPLKAQLIEMRYFGGMTAEESASVLSISVHLVRRELRLAQAWLRKEISA
jgi:RNA polymerase sigma factor (TIGR02999 family)